MVNFCKDCDVHMFFVEEIIEAEGSRDPSTVMQA